VEVEEQESLFLAAANNITPLAWLTGMAVFKFLKK